MVLGHKEGGEEIQLSDEAQDREQQEQQRGDEEWRVLRADWLRLDQQRQQQHGQEQLSQVNTRLWLVNILKYWSLIGWYI